MIRLVHYINAGAWLLNAGLWAHNGSVAGAVVSVIVGAASFLVSREPS